MRDRARLSGWWWFLAPAILLVMLGSGCEKDQIDVRPDRVDNAYGHRDLLAAVDRFAKSERSPARFRELALAIKALAPRFDAAVGAEAERHLVLLALAPLEALYQQPLDEQFRKLATTVWPTALGVEPKADEGAAAYAERICAAELALECKHIVPEYWPLVLSAVVWSRLKDRARESLNECKSCRGAAGFAEVMDKYERYERDVSTRVADAESRAKPGHWPRAGKNAVPWSGAPLVTFEGTGQAMFEDRPIAPGKWSVVLESARQATDVLGVHFEPGARVGDLRPLLRDAEAAGITQLALQTRAPDYPYPLVEYRVSTSSKGKNHRVHVRDVDTIQVLIQALDAFITQAQSPPRL